MLWRGFQKPKRLAVDTETLTEKYGKFSAQPFERGFGTTIGNALRRTLLSSIEGAAVTAVKIEGVLHEFHAALEDEARLAGFALEAEALMHRVGSGFAPRPEMVHAIACCTNSNRLPAWLKTRRTSS